MKRKLVLGLVLGFVVTLSACSGINQEDYDALNADKAALEGEVATLNSDKESLEGEVATLSSEKTALENELETKMVGFKDQSVEAYGYTHGGYVGYVSVVVTGGVVDVEINEAFLPHTLAAVTLSTVEAPTDWDETNTLTIGSKSYAALIMYNDDVFTAIATEAGLLVYTAADELGAVKPAARGVVTNLEMNIIKNDSTMSAYYDALNNGGFKLLKSLGDLTPVVISEGQFKEANENYWAPYPGSFGWQANIDALEAFLEEFGAAYDTLAFTKVLTTINGVEDNYWQIADTIAGATNSDFQDYFQLAQAAFGQLVTEVK